MKRKRKVNFQHHQLNNSGREGGEGVRDQEYQDKKCEQTKCKVKQMQ